MHVRVTVRGWCWASAVIASSLLSACGESRMGDDGIALGPPDDVFIGQTPYGPDHAVVISARVPEAYLADGAIHLTGGRQLVVVSPGTWRGYTGVAMRAEELQLREERERQSDEAIAALNADINAFRTAIAHMRRDLTVTASVPAHDAPAPNPLLGRPAAAAGISDPVLEDPAEAGAHAVAHAPEASPPDHMPDRAAPPGGSAPVAPTP